MPQNSKCQNGKIFKKNIIFLSLRANSPVKCRTLRDGKYPKLIPNKNSKISPGTAGCFMPNNSNPHPKKPRPEFGRGFLNVQCMILRLVESAFGYFRVDFQIFGLDLGTFFAVCFDNNRKRHLNP